MARVHGYITDETDPHSEGIGVQAILDQVNLHPNKNFSKGTGVHAEQLMLHHYNVAKGINQKKTRGSGVKWSNFRNSNVQAFRIRIKNEHFWYPSAADPWDTAEVEIQPLMGTGGQYLVAIHRNVNASYSHGDDADARIANGRGVDNGTRPFFADLDPYQLHAVDWSEIPDSDKAVIESSTDTAHFTNLGGGQGNKGGTFLQYRIMVLDNSTGSEEFHQWIDIEIGWFWNDATTPPRLAKDDPRCPGQPGNLCPSNWDGWPCWWQNWLVPAGSPGDVDEVYKINGNFTHPTPFGWSDWVTIYHPGRDGLD